eukprot:Pgem_evm1s12773
MALTTAQLSWIVGISIYICIACFYIPLALIGAHEIKRHLDFDVISQETIVDLLQKKAQNVNSLKFNNNEIESLSTLVTTEAFNYVAKNIEIFLTSNNNQKKLLSKDVSTSTQFGSLLVMQLGVTQIAERYEIAAEPQLVQQVIREKIAPLVISTFMSNPTSLNTTLFKHFVTDFNGNNNSSFVYLCKCFSIGLEKSGQKIINEPNLRVLTSGDEGGNNTVATQVVGKGLADAFGVSALEMAKVGVRHFASWKYDSDTAILTTYGLPMLIFTLVIVVVYGGLAFLNREEIEIRTKYHKFLVILFVCSLIVAVGNYAPLFTNKLSLDTKAGIYMVSSAGNYFLPLLWHIPIMCVPLILMFGYVSTEFTFCTTTSWMVIPGVVVNFIFLLESIVLIILTRKSWSLFSDFRFNVRTYVSFFIIYVMNASILLTEYKSAMDMARSGALLVIAYTSFIVTGYLLDAFTLIFVKIYCRKLGYNWLEDFDFVAQKQETVTDVKDYINDQELYGLLFSYAKEQHCEENLLFLTEYYGIESSANIEMEDVSRIFQKFIIPGSEFEVNLIGKTVLKVMGAYQECQNKYLEADKVKFTKLKN